jgi:histidinol-phosphate aminotransferase
MFSERLKQLTPYVPGEQPQDRTYLKLNTNENPHPPSPNIGAFLDDFPIEQLRLYPDPLCRRLRRRIAEKYGVKSSQVFISNGSDEALSFCFYTFFESTRGRLLFPEFTYSFYPVYCDFYGIEYEKVPLDRNYSIDLDGCLSRKETCGLIFANPNAPTGMALPLDRIDFLLKNFPRERAVIIDEAYIDFGGESALALLEDYGNLVIVRTFSKSMSLAGLRLGFIIAREDLVEALFTVKDSFNSYPVDTLSQAIGEIALADEAYYRRITETIIETRDRFSSQLADLGWHVLPSKANFVFASREGTGGREIYMKLKERGILVRHFDIDGIRDFVRITIGTASDMDRLLQEVAELF